MNSPGNKLNWQIKRYCELGRDELFTVLQARQAVFVVEQRCAYPDIDALDKDALHFMAWTESGQIAAYARIMPPGVKHPQVSIGRVLTTEKFRGGGLGAELMQRTLQQIDELYPGQPIKIGAQNHLENFYIGLGFVTTTEPYDEDGIPHIDMVREADTSR